MVTSPYEAFGLSCPSGGTFQVCKDAAVPFIGCCTSDACGNGGKCPTANLRTSSFSAEVYNDLPLQDCDHPDSIGSWYTCKFNNPPFMGCCSDNPCKLGSCPKERLVPAKLSGDIDLRQKFLSPAGATRPGIGESQTQSQQSSGQSSGLSTGAIIGIAVGVGVLVLLIIAFLMYKLGWLARKRKQEEKKPEEGQSPTQQPMVQPSPQPAMAQYDHQTEPPYYDYQSRGHPSPGPYRDSYVSSVTGTAVGSPRNTMEYHKSQQYGYSPDMYGNQQPFPGASPSPDPRYPSPAYSYHNRSPSGGAGGPPQPAPLPAVYEIDSQPAPAMELDSGPDSRAYKPYTPGQPVITPGDQGGLGSPVPSPLRLPGDGGAGSDARAAPINVSAANSEFGSPLGSPTYPQQGGYTAVPLDDNDTHNPRR